MHALLLSTNTDLPSCTIHLPLHTIPATPRDMMIRFRSLKSSSTAFPLCPQGQHLHFKLTRLHLGSLALRSAVLPLGNLQHLITQTLLPGAKKVYEQFLLRDFNPIRFIADNGLRTQYLILKKNTHHVPVILQISNSVRFPQSAHPSSGLHAQIRLVKSVQFLSGLHQ